MKSDPPAADAATLGAALKCYAEQLSSYATVQAGFNLTYPVAGDLLLPFGDFLAKYNLDALAYDTFIFAQGYSPIMNLTTLYVIKQFGLPLIADLGSGSFLAVASHNTHELYYAIYAKLPKLFMLNTSVLEVVRTAHEVLCQGPWRERDRQDNPDQSQEASLDRPAHSEQL